MTSLRLVSLFALFMAGCGAGYNLQYIQTRKAEDLAVRAVRAAADAQTQVQTLLDSDKTLKQQCGSLLQSNKRLGDAHAGLMSESRKLVAASEQMRRNMDAQGEALTQCYLSRAGVQ